MVDAIVGGVIMVVATTSLLLAIEVAEKAISSAGRYCLTSDEKTVLSRVGLGSEDLLNTFWSENLSNASTYLKSGVPETSSNVPAKQCKSGG